MTAANSGVPAKPRRSRDEVDGATGSGADAMLFLKLLADALAFQARQIVDEEFALEVVALVLNADGQHAVGHEFERLAVSIECAYPDVVRALDQLVETGDGEAPFLGLLLTLRGDRSAD